MFADQCQYGLLTRDKDGVGYAREATNFMTNSPCVAARCQRRCPNRHGHAVHRHMQLIGSKTKDAQIYPKGLCRAICEGLRDQLKVDEDGRFTLANLQGTQRELKDIKAQLEEYKIVEEGYDEEVCQAWDDVSGAELNP